MRFLIILVLAFLSSWDVWAQQTYSAVFFEDQTTEIWRDGAKAYIVQRQPDGEAYIFVDGQDSWSLHGNVAFYYPASTWDAHFATCHEQEPTNYTLNLRDFVTAECNFHWDGEVYGYNDGLFIPWREYSQAFMFGAPCPDPLSCYDAVTVSQDYPCTGTGGTPTECGNCVAGVCVMQAYHPVAVTNLTPTQDDGNGSICFAPSVSLVTCAMSYECTPGSCNCYTTPLKITHIWTYAASGSYGPETSCTGGTPQ